MITNGEFVSRVVNGIHALDKDSHVSRRWILNIGRTKAESYTAQRWDDGTLLGDHRLLTYVTCLEMIEVDKIVVMPNLRCVIHLCGQSINFQDFFILPLDRLLLR